MLRPHVHLGNSADATRLEHQVRRHYSLAGASISTILSTLSRIVKRSLTRKQRIRLSNVNCFRPMLADARPIATTAGHGAAGVGLGNVGFHTSRMLGGRVNTVGTGPLKLGRRSRGLDSGRVSEQLADCFSARRFLAHRDFRILYKVVHSATRLRVHLLHDRNGLRGIKGLDRPVCIPYAKCCNESR